MTEQKVIYQPIFDVESYEGKLYKHVFPWHFHEHYTLIFVEQGSLQYTFHKEKIIVSKNQIFIINPFDPHYNSPHTKECHYRALFLPLTLFDTTSSSQHILSFSKKVISHNTLYLKIQELFQNIRGTKTKAEYTSISNEIVAILLLHFPTTIKEIGSNGRVQPIVNYIQKHFHEKLTIEGLCSLSNLSPYHFQRIFKNTVGLTINAYVQQCRMEQGKKLLRNGTSIIETALNTGYFDQSHFHRQFKKMYATTPSKF